MICFLATLVAGISILAKGPIHMSSMRITVQHGLLATGAVAIGQVAQAQRGAPILGHQSAFRAPWVDLLGFKLYAPWKLIPRWLAFGAETPAPFARAWHRRGSRGSCHRPGRLEGAAWRAGRKLRGATYGSARCAGIADVIKPSLHDSRGVVLDLYCGRHVRQNGPEHGLTLAPTRSGKGAGLAVLSRLTWGSPIMHGIKGENCSVTAGRRTEFSGCPLFAMTNPRSDRINQLLEVRKGADEVRGVQNIADILVDPGGARVRRDRWEETADALLTTAKFHLLHAENEKALVLVAAFLADPSCTSLRTLGIMLTTNHLRTEAVQPAVAYVARELLNKSDNERSDAASTTTSFLVLYYSLIAANTAGSGWRIADLLETGRPLSLYLVVPPLRHFAHQAAVAPDPQPDHNGAREQGGRRRHPRAPAGEVTR
jgi:type IV secretion system protein VirD4